MDLNREVNMKVNIEKNMKVNIEENMDLNKEVFWLHLYKRWILYVFLLSSFILGVSYYNTHRSSIEYNSSVESFSSNSKTYILLGDSILKNNAYVANGKSVETIIIEQNKNIHCFAKDHSKIVDVYGQINQIPSEFNSTNTIIFLSAGGNDILSHYVYQNQDITNTSSLNPMFSAYKHIIKSIQKKIPNAKIVLLDIYYPDNLTYKQYHSIIKEWNELLYAFANNSSNNIYEVIKISGALTKNQDFSFGIEPSDSGGQKIADLILGIF
jgi:hypothetical protein